MEGRGRKRTDGGREGENNVEENLNGPISLD